MTQLKGPFIQAALHEHLLLWVPKASWALGLIVHHSALSLSAYLPGDILSG